MRIAIVETGAPPAALKRRHGGYPQMLERLLRPFLPGASFPVFSILDGDPPPLAAFDGLVFTGSPAGVYEKLPWIDSLEALIRDAARAGKPQVGICFGHQLMAQAFGGRVEKSDKGWGVGVHDYHVFAPRDWMRPFARRIACAVSHQDQVTQPPPGAILLAGSSFCPNGALEYPGAPAVSFQMHPEFDPAFAADLIRARRERIPAALADEALASLRRETDRMRIAQWIAAFFQSA